MVTPLEQRFLDILDRYTALFPDGEHQMGGEWLVLQRHLAWMTYEELNDLRTRLMGVLIDLGVMMNEMGAMPGQMRQKWVFELRDVVKEIGDVSKMVSDAGQSRVN